MFYPVFKLIFFKFFFKEFISLTFIISIFFIYNFALGSTKINELTVLKENAIKNLIIPKSPIKIDGLKIIDEDNKEVNLILNKKVLFVNFWATWCSPCREEMPSFSNLQKLLDEKDFQVITIASGRNSLKKIKNFFNELQIKNLSLYRDPKGETSISNKIFALPTTIIIYKEHEIARLVGPTEWDQEYIINFINDLTKN